MKKTWEDIFGKQKAEILKQNLRNIYKEKTSEERYGIEKSKEIKQSKSDTVARRWKEGRYDNRKINNKRKTRKGEHFRLLFNSLDRLCKQRSKTNSSKGKKAIDIYGEKKAKELYENKSKSRLNKTYEELYGEEKTKEIKKKQKEKRMGFKHTNKTKELMREARRNIIVPVRDTSIELKIQEFLRLLNKDFFTHQYMHIEHGYQCDILIPIQEGITQRTIIECYGNFYHCNPLFYKENFRPFKKGKIAKEIWNRDSMRVKELEQHGFRVIKLWENEINNLNLNKFIEILSLT